MAGLFIKRTHDNLNYNQPSLAKNGANMKCPVDNDTLIMADRNGVEIDYCPTCRGVWLDRGELDKIIARSSNSAAQAEPPNQTYSQDRGKSYKSKKKNSLLSELFDF